MSRTPEDVNKLTESTYKNVMEQFNPSLRNLVNLGKSYDKAVTAMTFAGKAYFDALAKIGENAAISPVSREMGVVLMEISEVHKKVQLELEESCMETISSRQTDIQRFIAEGFKEALLEEKRRFCFLVDKHCAFTYQLTAFHDKTKEMLTVKLPSWQDKCTDATRVPDTVISMIEGLRTPMSVIPESSPTLKHSDRTNSGSIVPPPAPSLKAHTSPLASMFSQDVPKNPISSEQYSDQDSLDGNGLSRSTSVSSGMDVVKKTRVQTIFPHTAGNNETLLSFDDGDIITLLIQEERDGWLYGELEHTGQRGWFPSSYCQAYNDPVIANSQSVTDPEQPEEDEEEPVLLPPPDYNDSSRDRPIKPSTPSPQNTASLPNGHSVPPFLGGGNPFATVKLRPTMTNDRSAPNI
uniref:Brain-specific angiogenesis inhibitor 1-associated protein 2-like protein 1 n=1 Tax=Sinocyclocheilus grahami TaxID=75366 RepID=A0A672PFY2_SINGR